MRLGLIAIVVLLVACKKDGAPSSGGTEGSERGACYGNGTCNDGLTCLSNLCVRPPGADCGKIADKLGGLLLGNYAPRDERDQFLASTRAECEAAKLTKEEGDCLLAVPHRNAMGRCARVVGVGDCTKIVAQLEALRPTGGTDQFLVTTADKLMSRCKNETPSKGFETCVMAAKGMPELDRCVW
jgi:hypothetical protein